MNPAFKYTIKEDSYRSTVIRMAVRNANEGVPIPKTFHETHTVSDPFGAQLRLALLCVEELRSMGRPVTQEVLSQAMAMNWRDEYRVYEVTQRLPFLPVALPDEELEEDFFEEEPEESGELGIVVRDGRAVVSSRDVAKVFEKKHQHVLRDIGNLDCSEEFRLSNFGQSSYTNEQNRKMPMFLLTRDGFVFLAMGYTGKRAAQFKEAYINEFNRMEEALRNAEKPDTTTDLILSSGDERLYAPEEAAELLGFRGYRSFYKAMLAAGFFFRTTNGRYQPKKEYVRKGYFTVRWLEGGKRSGKWPRPMVTEAGIAYLNRLAIA